MAIKKLKPVDQAGATGHAAGTLFVAASGRVLLLFRSSREGNYAAHWGLPGGGVDQGETPERGAEREAAEEMGGRAPIGHRRLLDQRRTPNGMIFHTFAQAVEDEFAPILNEEHTGYVWADLETLPKPVHPSVLKTIDECRVNDGEELFDWAGVEDVEDLAQDAVHAACGGLGCDGCGGSGMAYITRANPKPALGAMDAAFAVLAADIALQVGPELAFDRSPDGLDRPGIVVKLAFDRDSSQGQATDGFDRLHVKRAPITKACVNPYYGREIPKWQELGLQPDRVYRLLRDPDEIKKGAATSHNVPLLSKHVPHSADEHDGDITVGTVGSQAEYAHPYLYNSLAVWSREGRDHVDSGNQKELSSAYSYDADMTPGKYEGEPYDGVMRNMRWNHVCLVKKGRAGSDVALDEALQPPKETTKMALKSMKATVAYGALTAFLRPKLAMDAAMPNIGKALGTFEAGKFKESTPAFIAALRKSLGKLTLAQDADLAGVVDGVQKLMASIDGDKTVEDADLERDPNEIDGGPDLDGDDTTMDDAGGGGHEAVVAYLKSKGVPDDVIAGMPGAEAPPAVDGDIEGETPEAKLERLKKEKVKPEFVSKGAMDAALKLVESNTISRMNAVSEARAHVAPLVGELSMAFDSAEGVYRQAFKMQDRDVTNIKGPGALVALRSMWDLASEGAHRPRTTIAQDAAPAATFATEFPNMAKVKRA